jgi:hypothetical protein
LYILPSLSIKSQPPRYIWLCVSISQRRLAGGQVLSSGEDNTPRGASLMPLESAARRRNLSEAIMAGIPEVRLPDPKATLGEIETTVDARIADLHTLILQDMVLASPRQPSGLDARHESQEQA